MGLLDVLSGMAQGPRGVSDPDRQGGGMSPLTMAVLALLAYKAVKKLGGNQTGAASASADAPAPPLQPAAAGGLGDLLKGGLGGLLAGGAAGTILSGGLNDLMKQFQANDQGETANSWVSSGPNKAISPNDLAKALGTDQISTMMAQSGLSREELLQGLSTHLPEVVNQLTPEGRLPTADEASRWV